MQIALLTYEENSSPKGDSGPERLLLIAPEPRSDEIDQITELFVAFACIRNPKLEHGELGLGRAELHLHSRYIIAMFNYPMSHHEHPQSSSVASSASVEIESINSASVASFFERPPTECVVNVISTRLYTYHQRNPPFKCTFFHSG
jgi:hypothetical protein